MATVDDTQHKPNLATYVRKAGVPTGYNTRGLSIAIRVRARVDINKIHHKRANAKALSNFLDGILDAMKVTTT